MGASLHVASETIGITYASFYNWMRKGADSVHIDEETGDQVITEDSFYLRFYCDVRRAAASCRTIAETKILATDPLKWLRLGPGRMFGDEWRDDPTTKHDVSGGSPPLPGVNGNPLLPSPSESDSNDSEYTEADFERAPVANETLARALVELQRGGNAAFSADFIKSLEKQFGVSKSNVPKTDPSTFNPDSSGGSNPSPSSEEETDASNWQED